MGGGRGWSSARPSCLRADSPARRCPSWCCCSSGISTGRWRCRWRWSARSPWPWSTARRRTRPTAPPSSRRIAAALGCIVWAIVNCAYSAEDLYAHRDPTTYNLAGALVDGSPESEDRHAARAVRVAGRVTSASRPASAMPRPGTCTRRATTCCPSCWPRAGKIFGVSGLLKANVVFAAVGLFVLFGLARRVVGPIWALVVMAALAVSLPLLYVARDTLSEPLALLFLLGGLLLLHGAIESGRTRDFALAGRGRRVCGHGAHRCLRRPDRDRWRRGRAADRHRPSGDSLGGGPGRGRWLCRSWLGWADVAWLSNGYYHDERTHILLQIAALVLVAVIGSVVVVVAWRPSIHALAGLAAGALPGRDRGVVAARGRVRVPGQPAALAGRARRRTRPVSRAGAAPGRQFDRHRPHLRRAVGELAGAVLRLADRAARGRRLRADQPPGVARARLPAAGAADHRARGVGAVSVVARDHAGSGLCGAPVRPGDHAGVADRGGVRVARDLSATTARSDGRSRSSRARP